MQNEQSEEKECPLGSNKKTVEKKSEIANTSPYTSPSWNLSTKGGYLCVDGISKPDIEGVIVLNKGGMLVMKDQFFKGTVQVIWLCKPIPSWSAVDHTVFNFTVCSVNEKERHLIRMVNSLESYNSRCESDPCLRFL